MTAISHIGSFGFYEHEFSDFEKAYLGLRTKEQRLYSNEEVAQLPKVPTYHRYYQEWKLRAQSAKRLINYLRKKKQPLDILEIGCGNGWLSAYLTELPNVKVTGLDVNAVELKQAATVFEKRNNLRLMLGSIEDMDRAEAFDVILFAASIQYFSSCKRIIQAAMARLKSGGEVHITDSCFYTSSALAAAKQRSLRYFSNLGFPLMNKFYFHHSLDEVKQFNYKILYNPASIKNKIMLKKNPFYWFCITQ